MIYYPAHAHTLQQASSEITAKLITQAHLQFINMGSSEQNVFTGWKFCHYIVFKAEKGEQNHSTAQVLPSIIAYLGLRYSKSNGKYSSQVHFLILW